MATILQEAPTASRAIEGNGRKGKQPDKEAAYLPVLIISVCGLPLAATILALSFYIPLVGVSPSLAKWLGPLAGGLLAIAVWLLAGALSRGFAMARNANPDEYMQIRNRLDHMLIQRSGNRASAAPTGTPEELEAAYLARVEATQYGDVVDKELNGSGLRFLSATGYINTWAALHRAEEALIVADPTSVAVSEAIYDELRLTGSDIPHADDLLNKIRHSVGVLSPPSCAYLSHREESQPPTAPAVPGAAGGPCVATSDCLMAKTVLRTVRCSINEYRDDLWDGLVRARNQVLKTMLVTGLTVYAIVLFLMLRGVDAKVLEAAALFFLFGAVVGLFSRIRSESQSDKAVEDYGLSSARLATAPLLSGLAAILGVLVIGLTNVNVGGISLAPIGWQGPQPPPLIDIFSISKNPMGFLVAAVFGLTPGLLIDYLQSETNRLKKGISNSQATGDAKAVS